MAVEETPFCSHCGAEMVRLKRLTSITNGPVYVCAHFDKKKKVPCDGWAHKIAVADHGG